MAKMRGTLSPSIVKRATKPTVTLEVKEETPKKKVGRPKKK